MNEEVSVEWNDMRNNYEDEMFHSVTDRGAGESPYYRSDNDDVSFIDYDQPTEHGDYNAANARFYNSTHVHEMELPVIDLEDAYSGVGEEAPFQVLDMNESEEDGAYWSEGEDSNELDDSLYGVLPENEDEEGVLHDIGNSLPRSGILPPEHPARNSNSAPYQEESEDEAYVPVSRFLSGEDFIRGDWYEDPRCEEFRTAFACLRNRKYWAKKYLLDMLPSGTEDENDSCPADLDPNIQDEVTYALSELLIPGLAKMSVEKLCDLVVKHPSLDLRGYLVDMDVFYIAYVIWGIDFYMNKKYGGFLESDSFIENDSDDEEKPYLTDSLKKYWWKSLSWVLESFAPTNFVRSTAIANS